MKPVIGSSTVKIANVYVIGDSKPYFLENVVVLIPLHEVWRTIVELCAFQTFGIRPVKH